VTAAKFLAHPRTDRSTISSTQLSKAYPDGLL
jgi:hypothetical protein